MINYSIVQKNNVGQDPMGKGPYGDVYKGLWRGAPVAIKKYQKATLPKHLEDEFDIYDKAKHPYIVPVHGICDEPGKFSLVYQFHPYNLSEYINGENYKPIFAALKDHFYLDMGKNGNLSDNVLQTLINLKTLSLGENVKISNAGIRSLAALTMLAFVANYYIGNEGI